MRLTARTALGLATGTAALLTLGGPAVADPATTPARADLVGVGSDTTEYAVAGLSAAYNGTNPAAKLYSFDASGASPITPKDGCAPIARPNGSSAGVAALIADGDAHCLDFARSSRGPKAGETPGYAFLEFARDALSYATAKTSTVPSTLTTQALHDLYASAAGSPACAYTAYLPQAGSGTRSFFLASIGLTETTKGSCAKDTWSGGTVQENTPDALVGDPSALAPFSVGRAIRFAGQITLDGVDDTVNPGTTNTVATVNPATAQTPGPGEPSVTAYDRPLYNVVRATDVQTPAVSGVFGATGWICADTAALAEIKGAGFRPSAQCGVAAG